MDDEAGVGIDVAELAALRGRAARATELEAELAAVSRQASFASAGIDLSTRAGVVFCRAYEGELSPEAIRVEWDATFPAPVPDLAAHARMALATAGGEVPGPGSEMADYAAAGSVAEVLEVANRYGRPTTMNRSE